MILIEPPPSPASPTGKPARRPPVSKRELTRFLREAQTLVGVEGRISVLLTDDDTLRRLNRQYRGKNKPTDVLSFPAALPDSARKTRIAGDLAISLETAARQAASFDHSLEIEVKVLLLHGLLHLHGMDHETDSGQMARKEGRLRRQLGLPSGLIQRVSVQPTAARRTASRRGSQP